MAQTAGVIKFAYDFAAKAKKACEFIISWVDLYMIVSTVVHGDGVGKQSGYPTANLNLRKADVRLSAGVYAAHATLSRVRYQAALVIHDNPWKIEVFFFNYTGPDFYGQRIEVEPIQMVSQIERHDSMDELVAKIHSDLDLIKNCFTEHNL